MGLPPLHHGEPLDRDGAVRARLIQELDDQGKERPPQPSTSEGCSDLSLLPPLQWRNGEEKELKNYL